MVNSAHCSFEKLDSGDVLDGQPTQEAVYDACTDVFLDDMEAIGRNLAETVHGKDPVQGWRTFQAFAAVLANGGTIYVADTHADMLTKRLLIACLGESVSDHRKMDAQPYRDHRVQFVYAYQRKAPQRAAHEKAVQLIVGEREAGRRVYVPCSRKDQAQLLFDALRKSRLHDDIAFV